MTRPSRLDEGALQAAMAGLPAWRVEGNCITREFRFADFIAAWGFMSRVALVAQAMDHHPDWSNVYSTVAMRLSTHDAGGITEFDIRLAHEADRLAAG